MALRALVAEGAIASRQASAFALAARTRVDWTDCPSVERSAALAKAVPEVGVQLH